MDSLFAKLPSTSTKSFLVKKTSSNAKYNMDDAIPYDGAKAMCLVDDVDNQDSLKDIVEETYKGLIK